MSGIDEYSTTPGSNTSINSIDISEGCSPATINNAIRQAMADIVTHATWLEKTAAYTAVRFESVLCDTVTTAAFTLTLPASPSNGDWVRIASSSTWASNNLTVGRNSQTIRGSASNLVLSDAGNVAYLFVFDGTTWQYYVTADDTTGIVTTGSPVDDDFAKFTDASTVEGRSYSEVLTDLSLSTSDSPQFTGVELGHATDTTLTRSAAGVLAVEGVDVLTTSNTKTLTNKTFDANGTGNSLSNVDIADLANGTDGELITWDASGAPTTVGVGTADYVLTSNGAGAAPTFQALAASGGFASVQAFTTSGTWTKPADITKVLVIVTGGGGSGGGDTFNATPGPSGGGAGATAIQFLDVTTPSTATITIGAGGAAQTSAAAGNAGGTTTWADGTNTNVVAGGGGAGNTGGAGNPTGGIGSSTHTGEALGIDGGDGGCGIPFVGEGGGGDGGASFWGGGGFGGLSNASAKHGAAGSAWGSGSGGGNGSGDSGAGKGGVIFVMEFK